MEAENHASDESVSSVPSMDLNINFNTIQNNHQITSANSSNVRLGAARVQYGPVHNSEQEIHHQIYPNNSGLPNLSLSLDMSSANQHHFNITTTRSPLFFDCYHRPHAVRRTLNTRPVLPRYHNPMHSNSRLQFPPTNLPYDDQVSTLHEHPTYKSLDHEPATPRFNPMIKKRDRDGTLKEYCLIREPLRPRPSIYIKGGIENGRMKDQSTHIRPLNAQKKNPLDGRVTKSVYDKMYEEVGVPIDPHLRLFVPFN